MDYSKINMTTYLKVLELQLQVAFFKEKIGDLTQNDISNLNTIIRKLNELEKCLESAGTNE